MRKSRLPPTNLQQRHTVYVGWLSRTGYSSANIKREGLVDVVFWLVVCEEEVVAGGRDRQLATGWLTAG